MAERAQTLVRLSDTERMTADPTDDIRGRTVRDRDGEDLGKVDDLLIDNSENKVRFLRVESGGILGLGATPVFIPVEAVTDVGEEVRIDQSAEKVAEAPRYDPDLREGLPADDADFYGRVYGYYGYAPFWAPGYIPPSRPLPPGLW
jgi:sporulation protein YlmC with PRC-barrel domain